MVDEEDRDPRVDDVAQAPTELLRLGRVETGGGLVHAHELRAAGEGAGRADELALALADLVRHAVGEVADAEHVEREVDVRAVWPRLRRCGPRRGRPGSRATDWRLGRDAEVLLDVEILEQLERLPGASETEAARAGARAAARSPRRRTGCCRSSARSR